MLVRRRFLLRATAALAGLLMLSGPWATAATAAASVPASSASSVSAYVPISMPTSPALDCPSNVPGAAIPDGRPKQGLREACESVSSSADPTAARAIRFAFAQLGADYACKGIGREQPGRFDCSSLVSRAYDHAGARTRIKGWSPNTAYMLSGQQQVFRPIRPQSAQPGDLVLYDTCPSGQSCTYNHVVMYLGYVDGREWMVHANACGSPVKLERFWGWESTGSARFLGVRRVARG